LLALSSIPHNAGFRVFLVLVDFVLIAFVMHPARACYLPVTLHGFNVQNVHVTLKAHAEAVFGLPAMR
jgi:hypothetical protein